MHMNSATCEADTNTVAKPKPPGLSPSPRHFQLSLKSLLLCLTYFAVASALALHWGLGVFVLTTGIFLTWSSYRGYLWWLQTTTARPKVFGVAWLLFAVSLALPALTVRGCGSGPPNTYYGWQVAEITALNLMSPIAQVDEWLSQGNTRTWSQLHDAALLVPYSLIINLPNFMILVSPWLLYRQQRGKGDVMSALLCCAAMSSWSWSARAGPDADDLRVGYYVWSAAITTLSFSRAPGWRTLLAMGVLGVGILVLHWLG